MLSDDNVGFWKYCQVEQCEIQDSDSQPWLYTDSF